MGNKNIAEGRQNSARVYRISVVGLMAALVLVGSYIQFKIPTPLGPTRLHLGNVFCVLSGLLFGGPIGGLASGIGSAIFDLFDPNYVAEFWITFIMKFAMGYVAGMVAHAAGQRGRNRGLNALAAITASATYVLLYVAKTVIMQRFVYGVAWETVLAVAGTKGLTSMVNGITAVVASLILCFALRPALVRAGIIDRILVKKAAEDSQKKDAE